jgi:hypothetical protein
MRNSTIIRKKRKLDCGCYDFAFARNKCKTHATIESTNKRWDEHEAGEDSESLQNLIEDADALFSRYLRLKYARPDGMVQCYTSGVWMRYQDAQCGHFISRKHLGLRWDENNCRVQSQHDNEFLDGNLEVFRAKLEQEKPGLVEWLEEQSRQVYKPTREEMRELIAGLRYKLKIVESKLKKNALNSDN